MPADRPDKAREALESVLTCCRECRDQEPPVIRDADVVLWGKLLDPEALGPKCMEHAAQHVGWASLSRPDQFALVDLRPLRKALAALPVEGDEQNA